MTQAQSTGQTTAPAESSPPTAASSTPAGSQLPFQQARLERLLIQHYSNIGKSRDLRFHLSRLTWRLILGGTRASKRLLDVVGAIALMIALSPVFCLIALLIKVGSPGPIFFGQTRVGQWGALFKMWKFRSMYTDAEERKAALMAENEMQGGVIFKMKDDPRITRVGKYIRRASIDELPQLWNVLVGDMSLVGPRPPVPSEVSEYTLSDRRRLEVQPGITCIWQVSGRSEIPFDQQVELDADYIRNQSIWLDIQLLLRTVPAVFFGKGAM